MILDKDGKPFRQTLTSRIGAFKADILSNTEPLGYCDIFENAARVAELRKSCGVEPEVGFVTFRRHNPFGDKP